MHQDVYAKGKGVPPFVFFIIYSLCELNFC
jgi:hypothetical protein